MSQLSFIAAEKLHLGSAPRSIVVSPGGSGFSAISVKDDVFRWTIDSGLENLFRLPAPPFAFVEVFSPEFDGFAIATPVGVQLWDCAGSQRSETLTVSAGQPSSLAVTNSHLLVGDERGSLLIAPLDSLRSGTAYPLHRKAVHTVLRQDDLAASRVVTLSDDRFFSLVEPESGAVLLKIGGHVGWIARGLVFTKLGNAQLATIDRASIRVWDLNSGRHLNSWCLTGGRVSAFDLAHSDCGLTVVAAGHSNGVVTFGSEENILTPLHFKHEGRVTSISLVSTSEGTELISSGEDGVLAIHSIPNEAAILFRTGQPIKATISAKDRMFAFHSNGTISQFKVGYDSR